MLTRKAHRNIWTQEVNDIVRGASGGFLFGIPLLYTMEIWSLGSFVEPPRMLSALAATFVAVFLLNRTSGFRSTKDIRLIDAAIDSVEALAIGIVCTTFVLVLLREINFNTSLGEALGKLIFESVPFSLGVALARQYLISEPNAEESGQPSQTKTSQTQKPGNGAELNATLADIGAALIGAVIIAFNIAPTDEVLILSAAISGPWLLAIVLASLLISYAIVFEAQFANQQKRQQQQGLFQTPVSETLASYLISLMAAALMLWFFRQLSFDDPWSLWLKCTLILGLPATIGGAAGRLAT